MPTPPNEASVEARLSGILTTIFKGAKGVEIGNQHTFRLGRTEHQVGVTKDWIGGRADVILTRNKIPLAVVELKAPGEALDDAVTSQALGVRIFRRAMTFIPLSAR